MVPVLIVAGSLAPLAIGAYFSWRLRSAGPLLLALTVSVVGPLLDRAIDLWVRAQTSPSEPSAWGWPFSLTRSGEYSMGEVLALVQSVERLAFASILALVLWLTLRPLLARARR